MNAEPQTPTPIPAFDIACLGILVLDVFGKPIDVFPEKGSSAYFDTLEIHPAAVHTTLAWMRHG